MSLVFWNKKKMTRTNWLNGIIIKSTYNLNIIQKIIILFVVPEYPAPWIILICLMKVDLPDSPVPRLWNTYIWNAYCKYHKYTYIAKFSQLKEFLKQEVKRLRPFCNRQKRVFNRRWLSFASLPTGWILCTNIYTHIHV